MNKKLRGGHKIQNSDGIEEYGEEVLGDDNGNQLTDSGPIVAQDVQN